MLDHLRNSPNARDAIVTEVELPQTVNYHYTAACEMGCEHCFAVFADCTAKRLEARKEVIRAIAGAAPASGKTGPRRLNFVGGEPTLHPHFEALVECALESGLSVSVVTNGYSLVKKGMSAAMRAMSLVGISVDSLHAETNRRIGRSVNGETISQAQWRVVFEQLEEAGIPLKINTTVTRHNLHENLGDFIRMADPIRWKVFQAMPVDGQNDKGRERWLVTRQEYDQFIQRHAEVGAIADAEPESMMRGSYAMIAPDGRFFDSATGQHRYSDPITAVGVSAAWRQIHFDPKLFNERTKHYHDSLGEIYRISAA